MYQIEHFSALDECVEGVHHFFDGGLPVPPMEVENVDIRRPEPFQACLEAEMHRFDAVSGIQHLVADIAIPYVIRGVLFFDPVSTAFVWVAKLKDG